ncbi:hypothetical protein [Sphingobacterium sp. SYP-B4668]|uniref:hypothetical protein n=1 Tax=Sphingobacterium sp. SYP-B4668 TaxID=2996035 RepID=UPI0022DE6FB3|nr:hypothetical protein [Sphingobacterium sp. SYP-B4668]
MKKILTVAAILGFAFSAKAQTEVTLNVKLHPIQTLVVTGANTVDLNYITKDNYKDGVNAKMTKHLQVYSTGGFEVSVKSKEAALQGKNGTIDANTINITASNASKNATDIKVNSVQLTNAGNILVSSVKGGTDLEFDVDYKGAGANAYVNKYFNTENPTVYTTQVQYSIVAK